MAANKHTGLRKTLSCGNTLKEDPSHAKNSKYNLGSNYPLLNDLLETSSDLKAAQEHFDNFISEVSDDLLTKIAQLKSLKHNEAVPWTERSYASVQVIMLNQYVHRIKRFRVLSQNSLDKICKDLKDEIKLKVLTEKHIDMLGKFKRRLKHMLDVTEKHVAANFSTISSLHQTLKTDEFLIARKTNEEQSGNKNKERLVSLHRSISESGEMNEDVHVKTVKRQRLNSFKSFSDHLTVLTKTYTNRR